MPPSRRSTEPRSRRACRSPWRPSALPRSSPVPAPRLRADERGSASLEFLTVGMLLLVPLVYLVLALAAVQGGSLAVEGAARHAARVAVLTGDRAGGVDRVVRIALDDYGIDAGEASVTVTCEPAASCDVPGTRVRVDVIARVRMPLVPDVLGLEQIAAVALQGTATQTVSRFAGAG